jgi:hypothetical protein
MIVPVDDVAKTDLVAQLFGQHERIKGQQQPVVRREFVSEDKSHRDELRAPLPTSGGHTLDCVEDGFD